MGKERLDAVRTSLEEQLRDKGKTGAFLETAKTFGHMDQEKKSNTR